MPNQSTEDYIKSIYKLRKGENPVSTSELAKHLDISDGSVTDMVKKLSQKKLISYVPYQGVDLTKKGEQLAMTMMRRHRLWEMFLVQFLGYTWDEVHDEAEALEHVTSPELERRLDKVLCHPKTDPHGDPIPSADGRLKRQISMSLDQCHIGEKIEVIRVSDDQPELLQYASKLRITLSAKLTVKEKYSFDGSLKVKIGSKDHVISLLLARAIFVRQAV